MTDLREKDIAVLQAVHNDASTTSEIREATTLSLREINYSINQYLQPNDLIHVQHREGREWREINGEQKYIWKPKTIELTDQAIQLLTEHETSEERYQDMSKRELIEQVHELETRLDRLENVFKDFRQKVMKQI